MNKVRTTAMAVSALAISTGLLAAAPAATASGGDDGRVEANGSCVGGGTWKLKAKPDDGGIEWEFEVDTNKNGQRWNVRVKDNGALVMSGSAVTKAPSGSFSVERHTGNQSGSDRIVARAVRGDRRCVGKVTL